MGLTKYKEKRDFKKTPEPNDKASKTKKDLRFVIQRHQASRLHYDLRLEMEGVLKSWAVPKGPSMNPEDKRLAMMTEDHPYKYVDFEGVIPEGNYGAGIMDVYDTGTYNAPGIKDKKKSEQELLKGLEEGNLKIELQGEKIKGTFALVKMKGKQENAWLLVKKDDKYAVDEAYTSEDYIDDLTSVKKGIKKEKKKTTGSKAKSSKKNSEAPSKEIPTQPFPHNIKPMLAKVKEAPFDNEDWLFELKYDGYRAITEIEKGEVNMYSRNLNSFNSKFKPLTKKLQKLGHEAVLDGEVVILNKEGKPEFQLLQNFQKTQKGELYYYVFDLLYLNGYELFELPLLERKKFLKEILDELDDPSIIYSDHLLAKGISFFKEAQDNKLEGIIAKKADSSYHTNSRSNNWLKIKTSMRQEAVIAGFTEPKGSRKTFGALVLGVYEKDKLEYIGHTGGGFNSASLKMVMEKMKPLIRKTSPFSKKIKTNTPVTWVKPELVCEISFTEWTDEGSMRHPIFQGLREDKPAQEVVREAPEEIPDGDELVARAGEDGKDKKTAPKKKASTKKKTARKAPAAKPKKSTVDDKKSSGKTSKSALPAIDKKDKEKEVKLDGHTFQLTSLDKLYWPEEGYTKGDVIRHYLEVSEFILPYLKDRPENMLRHPNGIEEKGFFHKDVTELNMEWLETVEVYSESNDKDINYLICNNQATLTYMNQLGCIEINPWNSRVQSLDKPDWIVIDLDPADNTFDEVVETALVVKEVLDKAGADSYIKTSGSSGMHIFIPMGAKYDYEQAKNFAHVIAQLTHEKLPKLTSIKRSPKDRKKQIYLDYLQNRKGQTLSVVYSVRPKPGATVSTPLKWEEVKKGLHPSQFTIKNIQKRLQKHGDLFKGVLGKGIDMEKCLENLSS